MQNLRYYVIKAKYQEKISLSKELSKEVRVRDRFSIDKARLHFVNGRCYVSDTEIFLLPLNFLY